MKHIQDIGVIPTKQFLKKKLNTMIATSIDLFPL